MVDNMVMESGMIEEGCEALRDAREDIVHMLNVQMLSD